jgi:MSHA pilin protein MshD
MNTGQMMLTIAAMFMLSMVILTANRGALTTSTTMYESRYDILGVSVANSIIEDATSLAFDKNSLGHNIDALDELTFKNDLGLDNNENRNNPVGFNDFDDYNCYRTNPKLDTVQITGTTQRMMYSSYCRVDYVSASDPNTISNDKTYHKKLTLKVFAPGMADTLRMSTVYSYWYFR